MENIEIYKGYKPLCYIDKENILVYKKLELYSLNLSTKKFKYLASFPKSISKKICSNIRILERILRLEPRTAIRKDNYIIISFKGFAYKLDLKNLLLKQVHKFVDGMSSVLSFTNITLNNFENGIYYGDYLSNDEKKEVSIYKYNDVKEEFLKVYTFEKGDINHIHQIVEDKFRGRVWVMTGDFGEAAGIWYTDDNFKTMNKFLCGKQIYRACKVFIEKDNLIYGTDTPLEQNFIVSINIETKKETMLEKLNGSVIYGTETNKSYVIATTIESKYYPDSKVKSLLTYNRASGINSWDLDLIVIDKDKKKISKIASYKKDKYPMSLCQFGAIQFVENIYECEEIIGHGNSIKKIDGKMMILR